MPKFGYFWQIIFKNYCHIWNQLPEICPKWVFSCYIEFWYRSFGIEPFLKVRGPLFLKVRVQVRFIKYALYEFSNFNIQYSDVYILNEEIYWTYTNSAQTCKSIWRKLQSSKDVYLILLCLKKHLQILLSLFYSGQCWWMTIYLFWQVDFKVTPLSRGVHDIDR